MRCPVDQQPLQKHSVKPVSFHACVHCHGLWFSAGVLKRASRSESFSLPTQGGGAQPVGQEVSGRRCPACTTIILSGQIIEGVEIDRCGRCRGVWMDAGEFEPVRRWYARRGGTAKSAQRDESSWWDYLGDAALQPDLIWEVAKVVGEVGSAGARTAAATAEGIVEFLAAGIDL